MFKDLSISRTKLSLSLLAGAIIALTTFSGSASASKPAFGNIQKPGSETIVQIVLKDDGEFDVLQAAVIKAGLVDALNGTTQYTVFAPTDAAFIKLLKASSEADAISKVNSLDNAFLTDLLLFHVTEGRLGVLSVLTKPSYPMLNGDKLTRFQVLKAGLIKVNINASNGVVHVVKNVLIPPTN
ncbi:MAG: fasciclin domain-containing protein [Patescibacteria group bacterium]|jgi:uncharacterized surface protein with fasciclin (FAS1) repeats|nr:fasciclin domain-containing protein [Patescibacteria group bacterium]